MLPMDPPVQMITALLAFTEMFSLVQYVANKYLFIRRKGCAVDQLHAAAVAQGIRDRPDGCGIGVIGHRIVLPQFPDHQKRNPTDQCQHNDQHDDLPDPVTAFFPAFRFFSGSLIPASHFFARS